MNYDVYYVIGKLVDAGQDFQHRDCPTRRHSGSRHPRRFNTIGHVKTHLKECPLKPGESIFSFAAIARGIVQL